MYQFALRNQFTQVPCHLPVTAMVLALSTLMCAQLSAQERGVTQVNHPTTGRPSQVLSPVAAQPAQPIPTPPQAVRPQGQGHGHGHHHLPPAPVYVPPTYYAPPLPLVSPPPTAISTARRTISRVMGVTAPNMIDFHPQVQAHYQGSAYGNPDTSYDFLETLQLNCPAYSRPQHAILMLDISKVGAHASPRYVQFWDYGHVRYMAHLWGQYDPPGLRKTVAFNLSSLAPAGAWQGSGVQVAFNNLPPGHGHALVRDRDFSFSLSPHTRVNRATLTYQCEALAQR